MFASILEMVKTHIAVNNLKQYLSQIFPEFEELFQDGDAVDEFIIAVRSKCSLTDCSCLEKIAEKFKLQECQLAIDKYHSILSTFCHHTLAKHSYVKSFHGDCSQIPSATITFKLQRDAGETVTDICDRVMMCFGELATHVHIESILRGSIIIVCSFPQYLEKQLLVKIGVRKVVQSTEMGMDEVTYDWIVDKVKKMLVLQ